MAVETIQTWEIGNCLNLLPSITNDSVDLVVTDIPYGEVNRDSGGLRNLDKKNADKVTFDLEIFLRENIRICKGSFYIFCGIEQVSQIKKFFVKRELSVRLLIWEKTNPSPMNGEYIWLSGIECCVFAKKKGATFNESCKNTVFKYPTVHNQVHPTQKPLELIKYFIKTSSNEGDTVHDSCLGSGTTLEACIFLNRNFIGFELLDEWEWNYKKILDGKKNYYQFSKIWKNFEKQNNGAKKICTPEVLETI